MQWAQYICNRKKQLHVAIVLYMYYTIYVAIYVTLYSSYDGGSDCDLGEPVRSGSELVLCRVVWLPRAATPTWGKPCWNSYSTCRERNGISMMTAMYRISTSRAHIRTYMYTLNE